MKLNRFSMICLLIIIGIGLTFFIYFKYTSSRASLEFTLLDKNGKHWIWDSTIIIQNKKVRGFYQTDFVFNNLHTGDATLLITAPNYEPKTIPLRIRRRRNILAEPVELLGYSIPNFDHFVVSQAYSDRNFILEIQAVEKDGETILNHPAMDLWVWCMISVQMLNGSPVQEPTKSGSYRGEVLFSGKVPWEWNSLPEAHVRYEARIPMEMIQKHPASYLVIDYLIILPDPRLKEQVDIDILLKDIWKLPDIKEVASLLDSHRERFKYIVDTFWNVRGF